LCLVIRLTAINEFHYKCWRASQSKNVKRSRFTLLFFQQDEENFFFLFLNFFIQRQHKKNTYEREKKDDENKSTKYGHELNFNKLFLFIIIMIFVSNKIFNIVFIFYMNKNLLLVVVR